MHLPFLQVPDDVWPKARTLARILRVPEFQGIGLAVALDAWALQCATDGDVSGLIDDPNPAEAIALAVGWEGDAVVLLAALVRVRLVEESPDGARVTTLEKYAAVLGSGDTTRVWRSRNIHSTPRPVESIPEPVVIPSIRIRMKTPEERAAADAVQQQRLAEVRARGELERSHRNEMRAAKHAASRVYFIQQDGSEGLIKIGMTTRSAEVRIKELQNGHSCPLVVRASAPGGRTQERDLHFRFSALRVAGEWFRPGSDLLAYVALVADRGAL